MLPSACMTRAKDILGVRALLLGVGLVVAGSAMVACGMDSSDAFAAGSPEDPTNAADGGARGSKAEYDDAVTDNGVILVHAAGAPAFRLCFRNDLDVQPIPDSERMPNANVVGVDVGSAVRIGPLKGPPGEIYLIGEGLLRNEYQPGGGGARPTCRTLLEQLRPEAYYTIGAVDQDLSRGVHLLVVRGCTANGPLTSYTTSDCGNDYDPAKGNLSVQALEIRGQARASDEVLPAQLLHLSQPLESFRQSRRLRVTFGDLTSQTPHTSVVEAPPFLGAVPNDFVESPTFTSSDLAAYETLGFRITVGDPAGGDESIVAEQSLAEVQRFSSPQQLPHSYYSAASNYVFLMLGVPPTADAGAVTDERRRLHLLAVPVITRATADAGADAAPSL